MKPARLLVRPDSPSDLTFPPPDALTAHARPALGALLSDPEPARFQVSYPDTKEFRVNDQTLSVTFNKDVSGAGPGVRAGQILSITPKVPGLATFKDTRTLEFVASVPFDPKQAYGVSLARVSSTSGEVLPAWQASFVATGPSVAGKVLGYLPQLGDARVVALSVSDGQAVSTTPTFKVLYDQPLSPDLAAQRIELERSGQPLRLRVTPAKTADFWGYSLKSGQVWLAQPLEPLQHEQSLELRALDEQPGPERDGLSVGLSVAARLEAKRVWCNYSQNPCQEASGTLLLEQQDLRIGFNNPLAHGSQDLMRRISVVPRPANLGVDVYNYTESELVVRGDFRPGVSYRIQLPRLSDSFGSRLAAPLSFKVRQRPSAASLNMPEGALWLDQRQTQHFEFSSRNVARAQLWVWAIDSNDERSYAQALALGAAGTGPLMVLPVDVTPRLNEFVKTEVDLSRALLPERSYLVELRHDVAAFDALPPQFPEHSAAAKAPKAVVTIDGQQGFRVHVHNTSGKSLVHVSDAQSGKPIVGALARWDSATAGALTNSAGVALLEQKGTAELPPVIRVSQGTREMLVPSQEPRGDARTLFPALALESSPSSPERVLWQSDRGIYRPGETLHVNAHVFRRTQGGLGPLGSQALTLSIKGSDGQELARKNAPSNAFGGVNFDHVLPSNSKLGNLTLALLENERTLGEHTLRVAAFEAPKFVVDVEAPSAIKTPNANLSFRARYLFGAPVAGANINWSIVAEPANVPTGSLSRQGLAFDATAWDFAETPSNNWSRTGVGTLDGDGQLGITAELPPPRTTNPLALRVQAEVSDESNRSAASEKRVLFHPVGRYAGLGVQNNWYRVNQEILAELGVADPRGEPVAGAKVEARLYRMEYRSVNERTASGAIQNHYRSERRLVGSCAVKSATTPMSCSLTAKTSGRHVLSAWVDGKSFANRTLWISGDVSNDEAAPVPSPLDRVNLVSDKAEYEPGEAARILIENPFQSATALVTLEGDRLHEHRALELTRGLSTVDFVLTGKHAPFVHATVTLIPNAAQHPNQAPLMGALRLPVALSDSRLTLTLSSDRAEYQPGQRAKITAKLAQQGKPVSDAEVLLFVVDEGVLRLTGFRLEDPLTTLWQGSPIAFSFSDTRSSLARWLGLSHVAGDGGDEAESLPLAIRKNFVHTALWKPELHPDASGKVEVEFRLPDNLTEFRMLGVAIDKRGRAGIQEGSFRVQKPILLSPVLPRFAKVGDRFEAGVLLHNTSAEAFQGSLHIENQRLVVHVPAGAGARFARSLVVAQPGTRSFSFALFDQAGRAVDRVEQKLGLALPGVTRKPRLMGSFTGEQRIQLALPAAAKNQGGELKIQVGENLYPELGAQLEFLLGYPHGCVEQTTSSTLPLIAARQLLPMIGLTAHGDVFYDERIQHGLKRLDSMRTREGGLAYWPGDGEPNVFGTAYAMRAVVSSRKLGIRLPEGLDQAMLGYLERQVTNSEVLPEVRSAIALSLAESGKLKASHADALFDLAREAGVFGKANIALALGSLPNQGDRVQKLVSDIEQHLKKGGPLGPENREDLHSFSSDTRALAQASLALTQLRPESKELPPSVQQLLLLDEGYTTQATAYRLLALSEHVRQETEESAATEVSLDGVPLKPTRSLRGGAQEYSISLDELGGVRRRLELRHTGQRQKTFSLSSAYSVSSEPGAAAPTAETGKNGPDLYRVFTSPAGEAVALDQIKAGDLLRVALLVRSNPGTPAPFRYLALSDALPAGFEPVDPSLETVAQAPDVGAAHPFYRELVLDHELPDHVELGDDKVNIYFDQPYASTLAVSYLVRATTPGRFHLPRASAELMYEPDSTSFSETGSVVIR